MDKRIFYICLLFVFSISYGKAQILKPIEWNFKIDSSGFENLNEVKLVFTANIEPTWYLYSSDVDPNVLTKDTQFEFKNNNSFTLVDTIIPINPKIKYDSIWEGVVTYFDLTGTFIQKIKLESENPYINGTIDYQVCSEIEGKCIPFQTDFFFYESNKQEIDEEGVSYEDIIQTDNFSSIFSFMIISFLAGLLAILTPCVFPMIPITVSYFTSKENKAKSKFYAISYGVFIILIFTLLGVVLSLIMGPQAANELATGWIPNIIFFLVFIFFGFSLLGFFEITIPSFILNPIDKKSNDNGLIGVFFMAFTLVLVSFSCTGPLVGGILVQSALGISLKPILGMLSFSMAFAIPFTFLAFFPEKLKSLPKSGDWMNVIKSILGFLEIAFAFKFLSIIDQAYHLNILDRDLNLIIWAVIIFIMFLYLIGYVKLHGGYLNKKSTRYNILGLFSLIFSIYFVSGLFGNKLTGLAGYLPPQKSTYISIIKLKREPFYEKNESAEDYIGSKYSTFLKAPHNLNAFFDYAEGLNYAKVVNKPVLLDFTGHGCVNCREVEARTWSDSKILNILNTNYILVQLYVDDKTNLPEEEWILSSYDKKLKKTIGRINADLQITKFNNNAQPFYVLLNPYDETLLERPIGYELDVNRYTNFLEKGIQSFYEN
tara:strand:+ start:1343 stop:3310 length:1968 start_codon:yes stop_codon:yes gene_type:complete